MVVVLGLLSGASLEAGRGSGVGWGLGGLAVGTFLGAGMASSSRPREVYVERHSPTVYVESGSSEIRALSDKLASAEARADKYEALLESERKEHKRAQEKLQDKLDAVQKENRILEANNTKLRRAAAAA